MRSEELVSPEDRRIMHGRVIIDDPRKQLKLSGISPKRALGIVLTNLPAWGHFAINVVSAVPKGALSVYSPSIIKNLGGGFDASTFSFLSSVYNFGVCILALTVAWISDRTAIRGLVCLVCAAYSTIFSGVQFSVVRNTDVWLKYAIFTLLNSGMAVSQSVNDAWFSVNTADPQVRCLGLALAVAGSNLGGIFGQNLFTTSDAPYYEKGFLEVLCIYGGSMVLIIGMILLYWNENRRLAREVGDGHTTNDESATEIVLDGIPQKVKNQL